MNFPEIFEQVHVFIEHWYYELAFAALMLLVSRFGKGGHH